MINAALVLARTLHLGSALLLVSLLLFRQVIYPETEAADAVECRFSRRLRYWLIGSFVIHFLSGALWFWSVAALMSGGTLFEALDGNTLLTVLCHTQFGKLWLMRTLGAGLLALLLLPLILVKESSSRTGSTLRSFALLPAGFLLLSLAWAGHGASGLHHHAWHLTADLVHLAIGSAWPVGLVPLAILLSCLPPLDSLLRQPRVFTAIQRFSRASLVAVIVLVLSGFSNALFLLPHFSSLLTSTYGQLLLAKVSLFLIMVALGARNRRSLLPRLGDSTPALASLRRTVIYENLLAAAVLLLVGIMGVTAPPAPAEPATDLTVPNDGLSSIRTEP